MNPSEELDQLLSALVDGDLSETEQLHLAALLRDDADLQRQYLDYLVLDSLLRWEKPALATPVQPSVARRVVFHKVAWALAACLVVTVGLGLFFAAFPQRAEANPDLLDRLVEWNLVISSAPTLAERQDRFQERADAFADNLATADLRGDERELAAALLANARTMGSEENPLDVAERLEGMSEKMLDWMSAHSNTNPKRALAMERHYLRFAERSLGIVRRIEATDAPDVIQAKRMEQVAKRIARRAAARVDEDAERSRKKSKR